MCYSKDEGGYRCMPSAKLLKEYRGLPELGGTKNPYQPTAANGAFWQKEDEGKGLPDIIELDEESFDLRTRIFNIDNNEDLEHEVLHLGNMISRYSDAKISNFDERLKEAQELALEYNYELDNSATIPHALYQYAVNKNLALGYESRLNLRNTLKEILAYGTPVQKEIGTDPNIFANLQAASLYFPSHWNNVLESKIPLSFVQNRKYSFYSSGTNEINITQGYENYMAYPSLKKAAEAKFRNPHKYETQVELVHELSHKFETVEHNIARVSKAFIIRRAIKLSSFNINKSKYAQDHFANDYVGALYGNSPHTEVFSMGMESTFLGTNGSLIGIALPQIERHPRIKIHRADIEHRNLTLGILASMSMPFNKDTRGGPIKSAFDLSEPFSLN